MTKMLRPLFELGPVGLNGIVAMAFEGSYLEGSAHFDATAPVYLEPDALLAWVGSLFHYLAPEDPEQRMEVFTWDGARHGCLEVRHGREVETLPEALVEAAEQMGARAWLLTEEGHSSVFVTLPTEVWS